MKKILTATIISLSLTSSAFAGVCGGATCTQVKITEIMATSWGSILIGTDADESLLDCTAYSGKYTYVANSAIGKNAQYSALLTAKTTNTPIRVDFVADAQGICQIAYVRIQ